MSRETIFAASIGYFLGPIREFLEEEAVTKMLESGADADEAIPEEPADPFDFMALIAGSTGSEPIPTFDPPSLFADQMAFVDEALNGAFRDPDHELDRRHEDGRPDFLSIKPPADLMKRFAALPRTYITEQKVAERVRVSVDPETADHQLAKARASAASSWPEIGFLSPLHPLMDWLTDKVLTSVGRNEAPVIVCDVTAPVFCIQGMYSNGRGQPQLVEWLAVTETFGQTVVADLFTVLEQAGVKPGMPNPGQQVNTAKLEAPVPAAVAAARAEIEKRKNQHEAELDAILAEPSERLATWLDEKAHLAFQMDERRRRDTEKQTRDVKSDTEHLIESMRTTGQPLLRVVAALAPRSI